VRLRQCSLQGDSNGAVCSVDTIHDCDAQRAMHFNSHKVILVAAAHQNRRCCNCRRPLMSASFKWSGLQATPHLNDSERQVATRALPFSRTICAASIVSRCTVFVQCCAVIWQRQLITRTENLRAHLLKVGDENAPKPVRRIASNPSIELRSRALASNAKRGSISCNGCPCCCGLPRLLSSNIPTAGVPPLASPEAVGFDSPVGLSWASTSSALRKVCGTLQASNSVHFGPSTDVSPASPASSPASLRPAGSPTTSRRPSAAPGWSAEPKGWWPPSFLPLPCVYEAAAASQAAGQLSCGRGATSAASPCKSMCLEVARGSPARVPAAPGRSEGGIRSPWDLPAHCGRHLRPSMCHTLRVFGVLTYFGVNVTPVRCEYIGHAFPFVSGSFLWYA
jgi:hypothetical protein